MSRKKFEKQIDTEANLPFSERAKSFVGEQGKWYVFNGRLLPETFSLSLEGPAYLFFESVDTAKSRAASEIMIFLGQLRITTFSNMGDFATLKNHVADHTQSIIDIWGMLEGAWYLVDIKSATLPDDGYHVFTNIYNPLAGSAHTFGVTFKDITNVVDESLTIALGDFRNAMISSVDSGFFCFRAIEALMQTFKLEGDDDLQGWLKMGRALNIDRTYTDVAIRDFASGRRHGNSGFYISGEDRDKCLTRTRNIIIRFCHFLRNDSQNLDPAVFEKLRE